jgi:hypothetical protein
MDILTEPMLFFLSFAKGRGGSTAVESKQSMHAIGFRKITRLEIITPYGSNVSPELKAMVEAGLIVLGSGEKYSMEIGFDEEHALKMEDFRPALPLVFRW